MKEYDEQYPAQLGVPEAEDCSTDRAPAEDLAAGGKKQIIVPVLMTMTKYGQGTLSMNN